MNIDAIKNDHISGADEIFIKACKYFLFKLDEYEPNTVDVNTFVQTIGMEIINAQPRMAPLYNLVNSVLLAVHKIPGKEGTISEEQNLINRMLNEIPGNYQKILDDTGRILSSRSVVYTYSRSSLVIHVLKQLGKDRISHVYLTESRPMLEGRNAALELAAAGIRVNLSVDAAIICAVKKCDLILLGADAVTMTHVVNKIGTLGLCLLARKMQIPVYVLAPCLKFLPAGINLQPENIQSSDQVWADCPHNIEIMNYYFEEIPLEYFTGIVTEKGVINMYETQNLIRNISKDPWLMTQLHESL